MAAIVRGLSKLPKTSLTRTISISASKFVGEGKDVDFETHTGQVLDFSCLYFFAEKQPKNVIKYQGTKFRTVLITLGLHVS